MQKDDIIKTLPVKLSGDSQPICMNHHDYEFDASPLGKNAQKLQAHEKNNQQFSFAIERLPDFQESDYVNGELAFEYGHKKEHLTIKLNKKTEGDFHQLSGDSIQQTFQYPGES